MGEIWSRKVRSSAIEIGRALSRMAQAELAEIRQGHDLPKKHNDMLDLLDHSYLGVNESTMNSRLPDGLSLSDVRNYLKKDDSYPELLPRLYSNSRHSPTPAVGDSQRDSRCSARMVFIDGASGKAGDNRNLRWQIILNLTLVGALRDADLSDDHRQILSQTYIETKDMVADHLPRLSKQFILRDYPFIHPNKGWSPFERI